jgi:hypothetical protein
MKIKINPDKERADKIREEIDKKKFDFFFRLCYTIYIYKRKRKKL